MEPTNLTELVGPTNHTELAGHVDKTVELTVPKGAHAGQRISVTLDNGQVVHAKVPRHMKPGMTFRVPVLAKSHAMHMDL